MGRITFLGTGDPLNEERAQTSLAVALAGGETLLLDTSSGTILLRQLAAAGVALPSIRHLFVTHRHFDHAGGLAPLLVALTALPDAGVTVYAEPVTLRALRDLLALTIPGVEDWLGKRLHWCKVMPGATVQVGDVALTPFPVEHGIECTGCVLTQGGRTVAFTADTRPCPAVVTAARAADLLIHEAYSLEAAAATAHGFGHSTAADAARAARSAGAHRLLLTHLRTSHFVAPAALSAEAAALFGAPVEVASDLAVVTF
jgi:ribonuclease Z